MGDNIYLGLIFAIIGNIINGLGFIIQKMAHNKVLTRPKDEQCSFTREPLWIAGFLTYAFGSVLNAVALGFGPQSLISPMQSFALATNAVLAPKLLGETRRPKDIIATVLIILGTSLSIYFGPSSSNQYTVVELFDLFKEKAFVILALVLLVVSLADYLIVLFKESNHGPEEKNHFKSFDEPGARFLALSYTSLAGVSSAFAILITKCVSEIAALTLEGEPQFKFWQTYVMLGLFVFFNILLELFRQRALRQFDALYVVPVFQVCSMSFSTIVGGFFFKEFEKMEITDIIGFAGALLIISFGIWVLSASQAQEAWRRLKLMEKRCRHFFVAPKILKVFKEKVPEEEKPKLESLLQTDEEYNPERYNSCFGGCLERYRAQRAWTGLKAFINDDIIQGLKRVLTKENIKQGLVGFLSLPINIWNEVASFAEDIVEIVSATAESKDHSDDEAS